MPYGDETDGFFARERELAEREGRDPALANLPLAGDIIAAATKRLGIDRLAKYVAEKLGAECGCESRRQAANALDARLEAMAQDGVTASK